MQESNAYTRNHCLDVAKGIACVFVVFMHVEFPGRTGVLVQCVSRFCVPLFFMVSGYYCYAGEGHSVSYSRKIRRTMKVIAWSSLLYLLIAYFTGRGGIHEEA